MLATRVSGRQAVRRLHRVLEGLPLRQPLRPRASVEPGGQPVADAQVSLLGRTGCVPTDALGRFVLAPTPAVPFEVLVTLRGGRVVPPIRAERLPDGPLVLVVNDARGGREGHFAWPHSFDPAHLKSCDGFTPQAQG